MNYQEKDLDIQEIFNEVTKSSPRDPNSYPLQFELPSFKELFELFRVECIKRKFSFQKLSERAIHMYITSDDFRKQIHNHTDLNLGE